MGDQIEFPHNDRIYFERAVGYVSQDQYTKALDCIEKVYANVQNRRTNSLYVYVLYSLERYEEALDIANEEKDFYLEDEEDTIIYVRLLIKNQLFLEAEVLILEGTSKTDPTFLPVWTTVESELENERERTHVELEEKKKEIKKELSEIDSYSLTKQSKVIEDAWVLDLNDLQEIAPMFFSNPMISHLPQRAYLELLAEKQDPTEYNFQWFNQERKVVPNKLVRFDQVPAVNKLEDILERKLHKLPSLLEMVKAEMMNDLLLIYPFIEEVVTDLDYWVDCYISVLDYSQQLEIDSQPKTAQQEKIKEWVEKFHQMAHRIHSLE